MSRYFDDTTIKTSNCKRCGKDGHTAANCTKDFLELSKCLLCAETGHLVSNCPQRIHHRQVIRQHVNQDRSEDGAVCIVCGDGDHVNCTFVPIDESDAVENSCPKCGELGHMEESCPRQTRKGRQSWPQQEANVSHKRSQGRQSSGSGSYGRNEYDHRRNQVIHANARYGGRGAAYGGGGRHSSASSGGRWNQWDESDNFFNKKRNGRYSSASAGNAPKRQRIW